MSTPLSISIYGRSVGDIRSTNRAPSIAEADLRDLRAVVVHSMMQRRPLAVVNGVDVSSIFNEHLHVFVVRRRSEARRHRYLDHTGVAVLHCFVQWSYSNRVCCIHVNFELNEDLTEAFHRNLVGEGVRCFFISRTLATETDPWTAATWRAVIPSAVTRSALAPCFTRT